jgi:hypothetical protein
LFARSFGLLTLFNTDNNNHNETIQAKRRFDAHFTDPSALPSEYKIAVYKIYLMNGGESEYNKVKATYYSTEDNNERKYAMNRCVKCAY